jgi:hypothetical protein
VDAYGDLRVSHVRRNESDHPHQQLAGIPTFLVSGSATSSTIVDGFYIVHTDSGDPSFASVAVEIAGSASPVLQNDLISGGGGSSANSIGIAIRGMSSPEITWCTINGGKGTGDPGSNGIEVATTGTPRIHDSTISGGSGGSDPGRAVGIYVTSTSALSGASALERLVVTGNDTNSASNGAATAIEINGTNVSVDIISCAIHGGVGISGGDSVGVGVDDPGGTVRIVDARIYGGLQESGATTYGVFVENVGTLTILNSEVHAGRTSGPATGVYIATSTNASIVDDTIYTGADTLGTGRAIALATSAAGVAITDDLLLGGTAANGMGVTLGGCATLPTTFDHTAFANVATLYECGGTMVASTVSMLSSDLPGVPTTGNFVIASTGATSCPGSATTCIPSILGSSWTATDDGVSGLLGSGVPPAAADAGAVVAGWSLAPAMPCTIAHGGTSLAMTMGIATDLFGTARSMNQPTVGAVEFTGTCN